MAERPERDWPEANASSGPWWQCLRKPGPADPLPLPGNHLHWLMSRGKEWRAQPAQQCFLPSNKLFKKAPEVHGWILPWMQPQVLRRQGRAATAHLARNKWPPFRPTNKTSCTQTGSGTRERHPPEKPTEDTAPLLWETPTAWGKENKKQNWKTTSLSNNPEGKMWKCWLE